MPTPYRWQGPIAHRRQVIGTFGAFAAAFVVLWGVADLPNFWEAPRPGRSCITTCSPVPSSDYYLALTAQSAFFLGMAAIFAVFAWLAWKAPELPPPDDSSPRWADGTRRR